MSVVETAAVRPGSFKQNFAFACTADALDTRSFLILKPHGLYPYLHRKIGMLHYWCHKIHNYSDLELGLIIVILCFTFSI